MLAPGEGQAPQAVATTRKAIRPNDISRQRIQCKKLTPRLSVDGRGISDHGDETAAAQMLLPNDFPVQTVDGNDPSAHSSKNQIGVV